MLRLRDALVDALRDAKKLIPLDHLHDPFQQRLGASPGLGNVMEPLEEEQVSDVARKYVREKEEYIKGLEEESAKHAEEM